MNKYTVLMHNRGYSQRVEIEADRVMITGNGDLKFDTQHGDFVAAYAKGNWLECWQHAVDEEVPEDKKNIT